MLTYQGLDERSARVAGLLAAHNVEPGDRVGLLLPNVPQFPMLYYGVLRAGAVVVPMNPLLKAREIAYYLEDSGAKLLFAGRDRRRGRQGRRGGRGWLRLGCAGSLRPAAGRAGAGNGGGQPRGPRHGGAAVHLGNDRQAQGGRAHPRQPAAQRACRRPPCSTSDPEDVVMGCLPLFHSFGQTCGLNAAVGSGACLTLVPRFDPATAWR